jgi:hypothetical protein
LPKDLKALLESDFAMGIGEELGDIFGIKGPTIDVVIELGTLFDNMGLFALGGRIAADLYLGEPLMDYSEIVLLSPFDRVNSAVNSVRSKEYEIKSVAKGNNSYEVELKKKGHLPVKVYSYECLPVLKDAKKMTVSTKQVAYDILVASPEDVFLIGLLHDRTYNSIMSSIDRNKAYQKYMKFPEELREKMNWRFKQ